MSAYFRLAGAFKMRVVLLQAQLPDIAALEAAIAESPTDTEVSLETRAGQ